MRVIQISDLHLSPTHGFFVENWRKTASAVDALAPDLIVITGDLAINGPDDDEEILFAKQELQRLASPWLVLPGNHDVGDEPPGQDEKQLIDPTRMNRWERSFGTSWWMRETPDWQIVGLNSQLFASELEQEIQQRDWLERALSDRGSRRVAVFMHKPILVDTLDDPASPSCVTPAARGPLLSLFRDNNVQLVATGHLHCYRTDRLGSIDILWAPATSFVIEPTGDSGPGKPSSKAGAKRELGVITHEFTSKGWSHELLPIAGLQVRTLGDIKQGRYAFLRDMPPFMPENAA